MLRIIIANIIPKSSKKIKVKIKAFTTTGDNIKNVSGVFEENFPNTTDEEAAIFALISKKFYQTFTPAEREQIKKLPDFDRFVDAADNKYGIDFFRMIIGKEKVTKAQYLFWQNKIKIVRI